jgi:hypothetical protein
MDVPRCAVVPVEILETRAFFTECQRLDAQQGPSVSIKPLLANSYPARRHSSRCDPRAIALGAIGTPRFPKIVSRHVPNQHRGVKPSCVKQTRGFKRCQITHASGLDRKGLVDSQYNKWRVERSERVITEENEAAPAYEFIVRQGQEEGAARLRQRGQTDQGRVQNREG